MASSATTAVPDMNRDLCKVLHQRLEDVGHRLGAPGAALAVGDFPLARHLKLKGLFVIKNVVLTKKHQKQTFKQQIPWIKRC